ncbi:hypothetical protein Ndes2526B_g06512 [Nannochloris sp. 'desiccata']|nr:hypothetical protein KSW81_008254 [Chlorella desiccata (nom. nud.)]KAH7619532.1 hypothetical protein NADE_006367 [Chlorella desiccata (nom. nud.)]
MSASRPTNSNAVAGSSRRRGPPPSPPPTGPSTDYTTTPDYDAPINKLVMKCVHACWDEGILDSSTAETAADFLLRILSTFYTNESTLENYAVATLKFSRKQLVQGGDRLKQIGVHVLSVEEMRQQGGEVREGWFLAIIEVEGRVKVSADLPKNGSEALGRNWSQYNPGTMMTNIGVKSTGDGSLVLSPIKCNLCGMQGKLLKCSACGMTRYCSKECQTKHWPDHKKLCKLYRASVQDIATGAINPDEIMNAPGLLKRSVPECDGERIKKNKK